LINKQERRYNGSMNLPNVDRMPSTPYDRMMTLVHQEARSLMFESMITYEEALHYTLERLKEELLEINNRKGL